MRYSEQARKAILEGELRKKAAELAEREGLSKPSLRFGRLKLRLR